MNWKSEGLIDIRQAHEEKHEITLNTINTQHICSDTETSILSRHLSHEDKQAWNMKVEKPGE